MSVLSALLVLPALSAAKTISIFGHMAPDTDTVTSAIIYAWELNERKIPATAYRLGELNPETQYVLERVGVKAPELLQGDLEPKAKVAIVDTNNPDELPKGITKASIHSIVDHHKLSGLSNADPLEIDMRTLCSATSILYSRAKAHGLTPSKEIAGLMLAGILSDSLGFRSPTTTAQDKIHAAELAAIADVKVDEFADAMLDAKAKVDHLTPLELIMMDSKIFKIGGKKLRVSVLETTKPAAPMSKQKDIVEAQQKLVVEEKIDDCLFFVVDIIKESATFVSSSPSATRIVEKAWGVKVDMASNTVVLPNVLSRKKQIIPKLEAAAEKAEL